MWTGIPPQPTIYQLTCDSLDILLKLQHSVHSEKLAKGEPIIRSPHAKQSIKHNEPMANYQCKVATMSQKFPRYDNHQV